MKQAAILVLLALGACQEPPDRLARPVGDGSGADAITDGGPGDGGGPEGATGLTWLHLTVVDTATGLRVPAKVSMWDVAGAPVHFGDFIDGPFCDATSGGTMGSSIAEIAPGAMATWSGIALWRGEATIPIGGEWTVPGACGRPDHLQKIPFGTYTLRVSRGLEYEITTLVIDLPENAGRVDRLVPISRTVDTREYLAADMHIHTGDGTHGSGDSSVRAVDRVKSEVATGIEVLVSSDHDYNTDFSEILRALWPDPGDPPPAASVVGEEATGGNPSWAHLNAYPMPYDPAAPFGGAIPKDTAVKLAPQKLFDALHRLSTLPLVQVNHPRLYGFAAYFDSAVCGPGGWTDHARLPDCPRDFDALEVLNGFLACGSKIRQTLADWYALTALGVRTTAVGNSDTHYTAGILAGFPRTYVRVPEDTPAGFDEATYVAALRGGRAIATTGPFVTLTVDGGAREGDLVKNTSGTVRVGIRVQSASWIRPDAVRLLVDGEVRESWALGAWGGVWSIADHPVAIGKDASVNVEVEGATPLPDWLAGEYLPSDKGGKLCPNGEGAAAGMIPFAVTNPVFVDADGDGVWKGVRQPRVMPPVVDHYVHAPDPSRDPADCDPRSFLR